MIKTAKPTGRAMSMPGGLALCAAVSMGITLAGCLLLAKLVHSGGVDPDKIGYGIMIQLLAAAFLGAAVAQGKIKHRKWMVCMLSGAIYFLILLGITALFFGGQYYGVGVTGLLVMGGALTAGLTLAGQGSRGRKTGKHRKRKHS